MDTAARRPVCSMRGNPVFLLKSAAISVLMVASSCCARGESVSLVWDPSPDTNVVGYALYCGNTSGDYSERVDVLSRTNVTVTNLTAGLTHYFVVTAYDADALESLPSNEVSYYAAGVQELEPRQSPAPGLRIVVIQGEAKGSVSFGWDPSPDTNVVGYTLWYGTASGNYTERRDIGGQTNITITNLVCGATYYFAITAVSSVRSKGVPSNEISYIVPGALRVAQPGARGLEVMGFEVGAGETVALQASGDLLQWTTLYELQFGSDQVCQIVDPASATLTQRFYRLMGTNIASRRMALRSLPPDRYAEISFVAAPGVVVQVQASEDLVEWNTLHQLRIHTNQWITVVDPQSAHLPRCFYRILEAPALTIDAPVITTPPHSQTVIAGANATFTVAAAGSSPLTYQWRLNGNNIVGATASSYTRTNVQAATAGNYTVWITNSVGSVASSPAVLTVNVTLTVTSTTGGTATRNPDQPAYAPNTVVMVTAIPTGLYTFAGWSGDASGSNNPLAVTLTTNLVINARFVPRVPDLIVDNPQAAFTGTWSLASAASDKYGPDYRTVSATQSATPSATATFRPSIASAGRYNVYVWFPTITHGLRTSSFLISSADGDLTVTVDQAAGSGGWRQIATGKLFNQGTNGFVRLGNNGGQGNRNVVADAVRWVYTASP